VVYASAMGGPPNSDPPEILGEEPRRRLSRRWLLAVGLVVSILVLVVAWETRAKPPPHYAMAQGILSLNAQSRGCGIATACSYGDWSVAINLSSDPKYDAQIKCSQGVGHAAAGTDWILVANGPGPDFGRAILFPDYLWHSVLQDKLHLDTEDFAC
jgi:hypothetical protein